MVEPLPSATVVLARDSAKGPELLFVKRRSGDAFGEAYTFPGGVLDADEATAISCCEGLSAGEADAILGIDSDGLTYYSAVVRELFEETGVLVGASDSVANEELRAKLLDGDLEWAELLRQAGIVIPCDTLHYFAHWITPEALPKRWTTRFFLAAMPEGQSVRPDGTEVTDFCWLTAKAALASARSGERDLPFPTRTTVRWMSEVDSVSGLLDWARQRQVDGVRPILPTIGAEAGERRIFMPDIAD